MAPGELFSATPYSYANDNPALNIDLDGRQAFAGWSESQIHAVAENPGAGDTYTGIVLASLPIIGDASNLIAAVQEPSLINVAAAAIGMVPTAALRLASFLGWELQGESGRARHLHALVKWKSRKQRRCEQR